MANYADPPDVFFRIVCELPAPSLAQTLRFARFVCAAHSWYKHLHFGRREPFLFFLDPHAGQNLEFNGTGYDVCDITEDSPRFHYTWQTTVDYRRHFGHWDYIRLAPTPETTLRLPNILDNDHNQIEFPAHLTSSCSAYLSAMIHPNWNLGFWINTYQSSDNTSWRALVHQRGIPELSSEFDRVLWASTIRDHSPIAHFEHLRDSVSADVLVNLEANMPELPVHHQGDWPSEEWLANLPNLGIPSDLAIGAVSWLERREVMFSENIVRYVEARYAQSMLNALADERARQFESMVSAMFGFLDSIEA